MLSSVTGWPGRNEAANVSVTFTFDIVEVWTPTVRSQRNEIVGRAEKSPRWVHQILPAVKAQRPLHAKLLRVSLFSLITHVVASQLRDQAEMESIR